MLDPNYILRLSEGAEQIASELHEEIVGRVVERIMTRLGRGDDYLLTAQDKWQLEVLQEAGFLREEIEKEIAKKTKLQRKQIRAAFEEAGVKNLAYDNAIYEAAGLSPLPLKQSPYLVGLLQRGYEATLGEWRNYTRTTANAAQRLFIEQCDRAYTLVSSGAVSYSKAVREAVERLGAEGVTVTYPSGRTDTIESATLRAVRTGVAQACAEVTAARMDEMGWDTVLVSAHLGARYGDGGENLTNHFWWQGKFYSKSGRDPRFPPLSVCGLGEVQGLCGVNCRHSLGPGDGEHNPYKGFDSEENHRAYDLSQRQRAMENRIRKTKREVMALKRALDGADESTRPELEAAYRKKAALLKKQNGEYNQFCEENDLKRLQDRLHVSGWNRSQAASASAAARKSVAIGANSATMGGKESSGGVAVRTVGKIDREIYKCVTPDIVTDEVIITDERIAHIQEHHPGDFEKISPYFKEALANPNFIFEDEAHSENTGLILKKIEADGLRFRMVLRLHTSNDSQGYKNSILSAWEISEGRWKNYVDNKKILYKSE